MSFATPAFEAACDAVRFKPLGPAVGNVTLGRGEFESRVVHVAIIESRVASGSIGVLEAGKLAALFRVVAIEQSPVLVCLDSAGARVSEGLAALGAFRRLCAEALRARLAGAPTAMVLGTHCFGGASFLSMLAPHRLLSSNTRLAMSGPTILAGAAGGGALDPAMRTVVDAVIGANARAGLPGFRAWMAEQSIEGWLRQSLAPARPPRDDPLHVHRTLGDRLPSERSGEGHGARVALQRECFDRLFPGGYSLVEQGGLVTGTGVRDGASRDVVGLVGKAPLGAVRAHRLAAIVWALRERGATALEVLLDCESHAATLDEERLLLSAYLADVALALMALRESGATIRLTVIGDTGGGVYLAAAAAAHHVAVAVGANVNVLPAAALASILGTRPEEAITVDAHRTAGVADEEIALGLLET